MRKNYLKFFLLMVGTLLTFVFLQPSQAVSTTLVINEIDYDQSGTDTAEFIEIRNVSGSAINLDNYDIVFINGSNGSTYRTIELPTVELASGDYYVVCGNAANVSDCDLDTLPDENLIENGAPDALAIRENDTVIIDALSYEGTVSGYVEGTGNTLVDSASPGLSRCPDGADADNNSTDFTLAAISPGAANSCGDISTPTPTSTPGGATETPLPTSTPVTCDTTPDRIYELQEGGSKHNPSSSPSAPRTVVGIVTADFQLASPNGLDGYYVQDESGDGNASTSDGIFVYDPAPLLLDVTVGQRILLTGTTREQFGQTEFNPTSVTLCGTTAAITPTSVTLPIPSLAQWEQYEGMFITVSGADTNPLTVTETFNLARFGEIFVSSGGRLFQPTNYVEPGAAAQAEQELNNRRRLLIDDGRNGTPPDGQVPYIPTTDTVFRQGFTTSAITGVLGYGFGAYRLQPITPIAWTPANPREETSPATASRIRVASFNLLNYFNTFSGCFGPDSNPDDNCRGADTQAEFDRQRPKTVSAIVGLDADVIAVNELENDLTNGSSAIEQLVTDLNAVSVVYSFINTGQIGEDAIRVGMLYNTLTVTPVGSFAVLDDVDPFNRNTRPPLAQLFEETATGERFIVIANHFKSKGSCPSAGDPNFAGNNDTGDGQGCWNADRVKAATEVLNWIANDPYFDADPDVLIMGDLNSYAQEDPIDTLKAGGFVNLIEAFVGTGNEAYSYTFDGQSGYLDHALANAAFAAQIVDAAEWHINADEPIGRDYNDDVLSSGENPNQLRQPYLYQPNAFRSSDHDPVIVGAFTVDPIATETPTVELTATGESTTEATVTPDPDTSTPTLTPQETATPDVATATPAPTLQLMVNGGFENSLTAWTLKNGTQDSVKCNQDTDGDGTEDKVFAYEGECAFRFKGRAGENAKLEQTVEVTGITFASGNTLTLSVYVNADKPTVSGKLKLRVKYGDGSETGKLNIPLVMTNGYQQLTGSYSLTTGSVQKIKVQIDHRSPSGKVLIDAVSLTLDAGSALLSLP
jgi:uncharacterized protein